MDRVGLRVAVLLVAVLLAGAASTQKLYKWVDEQGRVHFSDRPPATAHEEIRLRPPPGARPADAPAPSPECLELRKRLASYRAATVLVEQDALGNERQYSEEQRAQLIQRTQAAADEACAVPSAAAED